MSTDLIKRLRDALQQAVNCLSLEVILQGRDPDLAEWNAAIAEADAHLAMPDTPEMVLAATLTISPFKGYENTEFQYHGNLPAGTYALYAAAQEGK